MKQRIQADSENNKFNFSLLPDELKSLKQWVIWRYEERDRKETKVLYCANQANKKAKSNDSLTWGSFDKSLEVFQTGQAAGIGFVFTKDDPYVGIDLDHCVDEQGQLEPWAQKIVEQLHSYTEWSPSGKGLHIFVKGQLPEGRRRKGSIEIYDSKRFFTMTGNHVEGTPTVVEVRQAELTRLHEEVFGSKSETEKKENGSKSFKGAGLSDEGILTKAKAAKNGEVFTKLFDGNWKDEYQSQSEADLALCSHLAFWAGPNPDQVDRLFRRSKLYREKWNKHRGEKTYGAMTIEKAIDGAPEFYGSGQDQNNGYQDGSHGTSAPDDSPTIADGFLHHHRVRSDEGLRLRWYHQEWLRFNGKVFVLLPNHDLNAQVIAYIQKRSGSSRATQTEVKNAVVNLQGICFMPSDVSLPARWNGTQWEDGFGYLVVSNGILNLQTLLKSEGDTSLTPHSPNFVSKAELPFAFDPKAKCPQWIKFLDEMLPDPESRGLLRELFGYCLTYDTSLQKFFLFEGRGANGKGVVLRILTALLGEVNVSSLPLESFGNPHGLESTLGKLVNITSDLGEYDRVAEGLLKQFTGDDLMHFNPKYRDSFTAKPTAKLIIATNVRPGFKDRSEGLWRRLIVLPFPVSIPEDCRNRYLTEELEEELPGILNWAIQGGHSLRQRGHFQEPIESQNARKEFQRESNPARAFLEDNCEAYASTAVPSHSIYVAYGYFCKDNGYFPLNESNFGKEVVATFPTVKRVRLSKSEGEKGATEWGVKAEPEYGKEYRPWAYRGLRMVNEVQF